MARKTRAIKEKEGKAAKKEIRSYLEKAKEKYTKDKAVANRYVQKARRLAMKHKIKLERNQQIMFCKHCFHFLMAGDNCRVRIRKKMIVNYCLDCKKFTKFVIKKKIAKKEDKTKREGKIKNSQKKLTRNKIDKIDD